jgi:DNA-binding IclR family transcriptional regulator
VEHWHFTEWKGCRVAGNSTSPGSSVASRLLALLDAFDIEHRRLSLSELARRADLPLATAHRLVAELADWGALVREPSGSYVIGRRLWDIGLLAPSPSDLQQVASPFLHDIYAATRATVHLAVREDTQVLYVDRLMGRTSVPVVSKVGSRLPMHATGVGKALLAHAPDEVREAVLADLSRVTAYTVTQPGRLLADLQHVRSKGFAQTTEEMSLGACSVAVPVRGPDQTVVAALGIVVPSLRRGRAQLVTALNVAAQGIQRSLATGSTE